MILILASEESSEAQHVARALASRGEVPQWFDTAWFPAQAGLTAELTPQGWKGALTTPQAVIDLEDISAIYYRQSQPYSFPANLSEPERRFATIETRFGLGGLLASLPAHWVSHPSHTADAEYRINQMASAAAVGFAVPASLLTNELHQARRFVTAQPNGAVYKTIMHKIISEENQVKLIHTTAIDSSTIDQRINVAPHLFQHNVEKAFDARVVATSDGTCLGVAIHTRHPGARQDWTTGYSHLTYEATEIPVLVRQRCQALLALLQIEVGAFDFSIDSDGSWWFLEVNPSGAWAWIAEEAQLPIAEAIADLLMKGNAR
ncbi:MvdC/MvdD family ATP grasp protein [Nonomuraea sp. NPDC059007]|uniref:MvdC/MvdD family ATP grasp protein n=1 Tax=Nonomuraea sp. NPDC059007 TaxID=3346692 RepID=UPI0036BCAA2D